MVTLRTTSDELLSVLQKTIPSLKKERMERVIKFIRTAYGSKPMPLLDGVTLFDHAVDVTRLLSEFCPDEDALTACLLQHTLSVSEASLQQITEAFGRTVRDMVSRIHLLSHLQTTDWRKSVDDMKIMLVSVSDDMRVLLIALAIQSWFIENLALVRPTYKSRLCRQALNLFAPVAARLGIYALKYRLESHAFPECYITDATHIDGQLQQLRSEHGDFLPASAQKLKQFLAGEGITADVLSREKQPYSIFRKMNMKSSSSVAKITDLFAIRVIVPTVQDCYQTLGHLHRIGTPISQRFKDYIAFPKPNGYQSLHTSLIGLPSCPRDLMVEVQIRTPEMHREAEYGIAAHWLYKEQDHKGKVLKSAGKLHLSDVLFKQESVGNKTRTDGGETHLVDHIYVLTPRGDIIELPDGGTPLDFAFLIHTDLGLKFKSARVNGSIVPLSHRLENGDIVEIFTHTEPKPVLQWINVVTTSSAKSKLKAYFFAHGRDEFLLKGRETLNTELKARKLPPLDGDLSILSQFDGRALTNSEREDLLVKVGMGSVRTSSVLRHLTKIRSVPHKPPQKKRAAPASSTTTSLIIEGAPKNMPYRFAKCCAADKAKIRPELAGIVTRAGNISVHTKACHVIREADQQRKVKIRWGK